ncbi:VWA domain-containing protein [Methanolobus sp. ZRKC2]|uniref:VWA domain-containing protein n=1 Tax=Methanolobus sp. ZRKC2 TaxID=3125783 RepID=UPI00324B801A
MFSVSALALDVVILPINNETNVGDPVDISVLVMNDSTPENNALVNFTTSLGLFNLPSNYTNSSGIVEVTLNSTVSGVADINVSSGGFYNSTNVTFSPLSVNSIMITGGHTEVAGNVSNFTFTPLDAFGNINSSEDIELNILIHDVFGNTVHDIDLAGTPSTITSLFANESVYTSVDSAGSTPNFTLSINSTIAGNISISASLGSASNLSYLQVQPSDPHSMVMAYNDEYTVNTSSSFSVSIYDVFNNPVEGVNIAFSVTSPADTIYNSPTEYNSAYIADSSGLTALDGSFSTQLITDKRAGSNLIEVSAVSTSIKQNITVTGTADDVEDLFLSYSPGTVLANNEDSYSLSAKPTDQFSNPKIPLVSPIEEQVYFSLNSNSVIVPLSDQGVASMIVGPTPYIEDVSVTATYKNNTGLTGIFNTTDIYFVGGNLSRIDMYAVPNAVLAQNLSGNHESTVSIVAIDEWGHTLPNIDIVLNNTDTSFGSLSVEGINATNLINVTTDSDGKVKATFISSNFSGNATFTATSGDVNSSTVVAVKAEPFLSVDLKVDPSSTINTGEKINITTIISIEGELPIYRPAASAMLVLDRSGSMDPDYYAGDPLDVVLVIDRSGSMKYLGTDPEQPLTDAKGAAKAFKNNLASNALVGVVSYSGSSTKDLELTLLNSAFNKSLVDSAIDLYTADGGTAMGDAMADANELLIAGRSESRKVMIVLTDGKVTAGSDRDGETAVAVANANGINIYTIGLGSSNYLDESLLQSIASSTGGKYHNAPTSAELDAIYYSIVQEISDYDISEVQYGVEGFTPYDYTFSNSLSGVDSYETTFLINETINDLKVQLDWTDSAKNLDIQLKSPSGRIYGDGNDTTGYYPNETAESSEYIWIHPLSYTYPDTDDDYVENGNWTLKVSKSGSGTESFDVSTYIDKKSATILSSHAFMTSFDEVTGDKAGLVLYSYDSVNSTSNQTSYVYDNSSWVGYFAAESDAFHNFNVTWDDGAILNVNLYDGVDLLSSSNGTGFAMVNSSLSNSETYYIEVIKNSSSGADTKFTIDVSSSNSQSSVMMAYYDSNGGGSTPKYRDWDGSEWSNEQSANYVGARPRYVVMEASPVSSEMILGTSDEYRDVNLQVWGGSSWSSATQVTGNLDSYERRGFDIAYEQVSGDAIVAFMDMNINDGVARYQVWDGNSWSSESATVGTNPGAGDVGWLELASSPDSDEIILVTLDDERDIRAQVWDGSSWGNSTTITNNARATSYKCFDVVYEQGTGRAMVVWSDRTDNDVKYVIWNGSSWSSAIDIDSSLSERVYWVKMAADPNSNNIIMVSQDRGYDVYNNTWDGSSWTSRGRIETYTETYGRRAMDVAYEQSSGTGMVVWGDGGSTPKYKTWDGSSWSSESSASSIGGGDVRWVQLTSNGASDEIFLMTSDNTDDINVQRWDGSTWGDALQVESSSTDNYECFDVAVFSQSMSSPMTTVSWTEWTAEVTSTLENDSLPHLENSLDTITADGLTAIDEGIFLANNELSSVAGNSTIVLMTDGLDNAGYHSILQEAQKADANGTVIYTVGFGNNESEVDPVLAEIASLTGGEYYFAPNSSVLENIFVGIASQLTNFSAQGPVLNINVPYNYISQDYSGKVTYVGGSSNHTTGNQTLFTSPSYPGTASSEPTINTSGSKTSLEWQLPNLKPGDKWGIWYQLIVEGEGYIPVIMSDSTVTYTDLSGKIVEVYVPAAGGASMGGSHANGSSYNLGSLHVVPDERIMLIGDSTGINVFVKDIEGNNSLAYVHLYTSLGYFNDHENPVNISVVGSGNKVSFNSAIAGKAYITAYAYNPNPPHDMIQVSDELVVRPKGMITIS